MESLAKHIALDRSQIPEPILNSEPTMIELYWKAWELAWSQWLKIPERPNPRILMKDLIRISIGFGTLALWQCL